MFDANLRWVRKDTQVWAKAHYCVEGGVLEGLGIKDGDLILITMLTDSHKNPSVTFHLESGDVLIEDFDCALDWVVYEGNIDGSDFIDKKSEQIVRDRLKSK